MKIKNYTTSIPAIVSIAEIEQMLISQGACKIMKDYRGDGRLSALVFMLGQVGYKLPANTEKVYAVLTKNKKVVKQSSWEAQAERVAWRVLKDWLHAQLSIIEIGQAEIEQVLLPYAYDGKKTFYEIIKEKGGVLRLTGDLNNKQNAENEGEE